MLAAACLTSSTPPDIPSTRHLTSSSRQCADPGWGHYEVFGIYSTFRNRVYPCGVVGTNATDTNPPATPTTIACGARRFYFVKFGGSLQRHTKRRWRRSKHTRSRGGEEVGFCHSGSGGRWNRPLRLCPDRRPDAPSRRYPSADPHRPCAWGIGVPPQSRNWISTLTSAESTAGARHIRGTTASRLFKTPAIPATATTPAIPGTTTTTIKVNQFGGYGSLFANNSGCSTENPPTNQLIPSGGGTCAGDTRLVMEGTFGFWHRLIQGPKGGLRWGIQYSYFERLDGLGATALLELAFRPRLWTTWSGPRSATTCRKRNHITQLDGAG